MSATRLRARRVAFYGEFGSGNLGNDASLLAAVEAMRALSPDTEILCLCDATNVVAERYGLRTVPIRRPVSWERSRRRSPVVRAVRRVKDVLRIFRLMRRLDAVIVPGMGVLEAGSARAGSLPSELLMLAIAARLAGARFAVVSVGADHAFRRSTRMVLRWMLRLAAYRSFRDARSQRCAVEFGAPCAQDPVVPDVVFGFDVPVEAVDVPQNGSVGVGVIAYGAAFSSDELSRRKRVMAVYLDTVTSFVEWLLERGFSVTLLTGDRKDKDIADNILERLSGRVPAATLAVKDSESFADLIDHMRRVDYVVASRYHNIIAAALLAKPVISIDYMPKNMQLLTGMGLGGFHQALQHVDGERLRRQFADLERSSAEVVEILDGKRREYRDLVHHQWAALMAVLTPIGKHGIDDRTSVT